MKTEEIYYRDRIPKFITRKMRDNYYLFFTYSEFLKGYCLIDNNFNLYGLDDKLKPYYESDLFSNE